jgi:hypothetical protein
MTKCYDSVLAFENRGGLTLVSKKYFDFASDVMRIIVDAVELYNIADYGNDALVQAYAAIDKERCELLNSFLRLGENFLSITKETKEAVFEAIIRIARNARIGAATKKYKEMHTGRGSQDHEKVALRPKLAAVTKGNKLNHQFRET